MKKAKQLDFKKKSFMANGTKYLFYGNIDDFGVERYKRWQNLEPVITFGKTFTEIYEQLGRAMELINKSKPVQGHHVMFDLYEKIGFNMNDRLDNIMLGSAMFIVTEDEDLKIFDEKHARAKIEDWEKEGISYQSFFSFVLSSIPNFMKHYERNFLDSLKKEKKDSEVGGK